MGMFGAMGKALKAPAKAMNKLPGMGAMNKAVGKAPGMGAMQGAMGIGPSVNAGGGLGAKMAQLRPQPEAPPQQMDAPPPPMQADMPAPGMDGGGMEVRDAPMPQIGQGAPMGMPAQPQQGGFMSQLAQKYGQARPGMGQQRGGGNMGRAMGGAMRRMF